MCKETLKPAYNFEPYLRKFVEGEIFSKFTTTWKRPHRVKKFRNIYPGKKSEMQGKIGVVADTSGSMYDDDMSVIAKNLKFINQYAQVILFEVDEAIHDVREFTPATFDNILKGGGGTEFNDVLKVVENYKANKGLLDCIPLKRREAAFQLVRDIQALIFITDGQLGGLPKKPPKIPVLWALTHLCDSAPVKWGKVIYLDNQPDKHM
jgi:predicted metal-dependent peptidase